MLTQKCEKKMYARTFFENLCENHFQKSMPLLSHSLLLYQPTLPL